MSIHDEITALLEAGALLQMKAKLRRNQQRYRLIYVTPDVVQWLRETLINARSDDIARSDSSPVEQLDTHVRRFVAGDDMLPPAPHLMTPSSTGVWRFRTADVRIVGWFPMRSVLIVSGIELK